MVRTTPGHARGLIAAGAVLGALAISTAACGSDTGSPAGPTPVEPPAPAPTDRDALVALYNAAGGPDWTDTTNWLSDEPLETWYGVETENDRVTSLDLCGPDGNNLHGTIPRELGTLTHLRDLRLSNNFLTGTIPSTLGNLTGLEVLRLSNNSLSGPVPAALANLTNLVELRLHLNRLTGELPQGLMNLSSLERLRIEDNAGLCAPMDADYQEWLATLDEFQSDCAGPAAGAAPGRRPAVVFAAALAGGGAAFGLQLYGSFGSGPKSGGGTRCPVAAS